MGKKKKKRKIQLPQIHISKWITPELYLALSPIPQSLHQTFTPANIFSFCITTADSINWGQDWQNKQTNKKTSACATLKSSTWTVAGASKTGSSL